MKKGQVLDLTDPSNKNDQLKILAQLPQPEGANSILAFVYVGTPG